MGFESGASRSSPERRSESGNRLGVRAALLFVNFFLIITAYYQLKPASRSLFLEHLGADHLPYVWIGTALVLGTVITFYHRLVTRFPRDRVVLATCLSFALLLVGFRIAMAAPSAPVAAAFYIFVDIMGVILVEQLWSLTDSLYSTREGQRWYGTVGTGGLVGGVAGGGIAATLIEFTPLQTPDLLLVAAGILLLILTLTHWMDKLGLYREGDPRRRSTDPRGGWRVLGRSRYLVLIAVILLLAQLAQPIVEYQFMKIIEEAYSEQESRTAYLSLFFSTLGLVSIAVNLFLTPLIHRLFGAIAGLLVQPLALGLSAVAFMAHPALLGAAIMKISDRGLSYSINRASRELLYVPIDPVLIYQAKAWIDMLGYRLFKVIGSVLILVLTQWLPWRLPVEHLSWATMLICVVWAGSVIRLSELYQPMLSPSVGAAAYRAPEHQ